jgi:ribonucleotide reductase beta subunit family protein with ferritin-like domain
LVAFAAVEGIFFSGSFCAIFWLRKRWKTNHNVVVLPQLHKMLYDVCRELRYEHC